MSNTKSMSLLMKSNYTIFEHIFSKPKIKIFPKLEYLLKFNGIVKDNYKISSCSAILYQNNVEIWNDSQFLGYDKSREYSKYMGLIIGLNKAMDLKINELIVESDCNSIIEQINGNEKVKLGCDYNELYNISKDFKNRFKIIIFNAIEKKDNIDTLEMCENNIQSIQLSVKSNRK